MCAFCNLSLLLLLNFRCYLSVIFRVLCVLIRIFLNGAISVILYRTETIESLFDAYCRVLKLYLLLARRTNARFTR